MTLFGLHPRKCKCCGKQFDARDEWVYKKKDPHHDRYFWFCSWHCYRKAW